MCSEGSLILILKIKLTIVLKKEIIENNYFLQKFENL